MTYICQWTRPSLIQIMACCLFCTKSLSEPMLLLCWFDPEEQTSMIFQWKFKHLKKMHLKVLPVKWWPFCLGLIVLICISSGPSNEIFTLTSLLLLKMRFLCPILIIHNAMALKEFSICTQIMSSHPYLLWSYILRHNCMFVLQMALQFYFDSTCVMMHSGKATNCWSNISWYINNISTYFILATTRSSMQFHERDSRS